MSTTAAPMIVTQESRTRFAIQIRSHRLVVDQTARGGGDDAGPEPIELLGAALGTCVSYYVAEFCRARLLPSDGIVVTVQQQMANDPRRIAEFAVAVSLPPSFPERYLETVERVARSCPAHNTLVHGAGVAVTIEKSEAPTVA
jgi:putative redox protein